MPGISATRGPHAFVTSANISTSGRNWFGRCLVGVVIFLEFDGAEVVDPFLDAAGIVEAVDVFKGREVHFGPGGEDEAADALGLDQLTRRAVSLMGVYCPGSRNRRSTVCQRVLGEPIGSKPRQIGVGSNDPGRVSASMAQAACGYIVTAKVMTMATSQHTHCHRLSSGMYARLCRRWEPRIASRPLWERRGSTANRATALSGGALT